MENLSGICALVSGGASEVGSQLIRELAHRGASVLAADSDEEQLEKTIAGLGLDNPDEIFTHVLEGGDLVSWWDLGNLVAAYFHTLHLFIHIAEEKPAVPVRTLGQEALREAQAVSTDSLLTAVARLEKYLIAASEEDEVGACVIAITPNSEGGADFDVPGAACHAATSALADAMTRAYAEGGLNVRVHAIRTSGVGSQGAAAAAIALLDS